MKTESEKIKDIFTKLRNFGIEVDNFNNNKANSKGIRNHPDWEFVTKKHVVYAEVKLGKDKLSDGQKKRIAMLSHLMGLPGSRIYITIIKNSKQAIELQQRILEGEL